MTENTEKGWGFKSKENEEELPLSVDEPVAEEEAVVAEPVLAPVSTEAEEAKMLQDAIAKERAKVAESKKPFGSSPDRDVARSKRYEEVQKQIDLLYTTGMWGEHTKYECKECPFSTLDEQLIRTHVKKHI